MDSCNPYSVQNIDEQRIDELLVEDSFSEEHYPITSRINQIGEIIAVEKVRKLEKTLTTMGKTVEKLAANQPAFIYLTDTGHHESTEYFKKILATHFAFWLA